MLSLHCSHKQRLGKPDMLQACAIQLWSRCVWNGCFEDGNEGWATSKQLLYIKTVIRESMGDQIRWSYQLQTICDQWITISIHKNWVQPEPQRSKTEFVSQIETITKWHGRGKLTLPWHISSLQPAESGPLLQSHALQTTCTQLFASCQLWKKQSPSCTLRVWETSWSSQLCTVGQQMQSQQPLISPSHKKAAVLLLLQWDWTIGHLLSQTYIPSSGQQRPTRLWKETISAAFLPQDLLSVGPK